MRKGEGAVIMKIRFSSLLTIVLLGVLVFNLSGQVSTAKAATLCNAAQFVADVTIPDDTYINPGASFTKTWRLKNVGTCAWSNKYALVFSSGERMGGMSPIFLPRWISPGQSVDVTVDLVAPVDGGTYRGYWKLQNASGTPFGIGGAAANAFWVEIRVLGPTQSVVSYDFVANMCSAKWVYDGGPISCPVNNSKKDLGYVVTVNNPTLENGAAANAPALLTIPHNKVNGAIQGIFPIGDVLKGDRFQSIISCQWGATDCAVTYQLDYSSGAGSLVTLWKFKEQYDGLYYQVDIDLSPLANRKDVKIALGIYAGGSASGDQPLWVAPHIVRNVQAPITTPTFTPTPPPTATPGPTGTPIPVQCTDRAQFVTDVTVPDGTLFPPNQTFLKTWRLKNVGTCTWSPSYALTFVSGASMGATEASLATTVLPGQNVDASVNLTAPSVAGSYRGFWELKNANGQIFGIGSTFSNPFWVDIKVAGTPVATATPTATGTPGSATATPTGTAGSATSTPTPTVTPTMTPTTQGPTPTPTSFGTGWFLFTNTKYAFAFQLPPNSTVASKTDNSSRILLPFVSGTNLMEKYLDVSVADPATTCRSPLGIGGVQFSQPVTINGIPFLKEGALEGAVGNLYDWTAYSTVKGTACISMTFVLHSLNPGAMATPLPTYDSAAEKAVISQIMATYGNQ
jgi:Ig-like domain-containing protein